MARPKLWLIAGPNGAGKTTLVQAAPISQLLPHTRFLNPDDVTRVALNSLGFSSFAAVPDDVLRRVFIESANVVFDDLKRGLKAGECVGVETVLSTGKYRELVELVRRRRGFVGLIYVAISSPRLSMERVRQRVSRGGHDVPPQKIADRWRRSLEQLGWFAKRATVFWVFDNSDSNPDIPPRLVARGKKGCIESLDAITFPELHVALAELGQSKR